MAPKTPFWYCEHFKSIEPRSVVVSCFLGKNSTKAADGCGSYQRVPGVDDDGWSPIQIVIAPTKPEPQQAPRARSTGRDG